MKCLGHKEFLVLVGAEVVLFVARYCQSDVPHAVVLFSPPYYSRFYWCLIKKEKLNFSSCYSVWSGLEKQGLCESLTDKQGQRDKIGSNTLTNRYLHCYEFSAKNDVLCDVDERSFVMNAREQKVSIISSNVQSRTLKEGNYRLLHFIHSYHSIRQIGTDDRFFFLLGESRSSCPSNTNKC